MVRHAAQEELIGVPIRVVAATNESLRGLAGTVIDETKHTLVVRTDTGRKVLKKEQITIAATIRGQPVEIDGARLAKRPEKRIDTQ
jgi:ribonuclease P protein subunit POP4